MNSYLWVSDEVRKAVAENRPGCSVGIYDHLPWHAISAKCANSPAGGKNRTGERRSARNHCHFRRQTLRGYLC